MCEVLHYRALSWGGRGEPGTTCRAGYRARSASAEGILYDGKRLRGNAIAVCVDPGRTMNYSSGREERTGNGNEHGEPLPTRTLSAGLG